MIRYCKIANCTAAASGAAATLALVLLALFAAFPTGIQAQSALDRTPDISGGWVGTPGTAHFNFLHRFSVFDGDEKVVANTPTFLLAAPLPGQTLLGFRYASESLVVPSNVNEWELFGRWKPVSVDGGAPVDLAATAAYNAAAQSADGELLVGIPLGPARLMGVARVFSDYVGTGESGSAFGIGGTLRITDGIALAGDFVAASDLPDDPDSDWRFHESTAWGAAIQLRIPTTPHTLSLQATNTRTSTLQGSSVGRLEEPDGNSQIVWGFEFTIPFTFSRYFGGGGDANEEAAEAVQAPAGESVTVTMTDDLRFMPETLRIQAGQTVVWRNTSQLLHTVTADPEGTTGPGGVTLPEGATDFDSGDMRPGDVFSHTFTTPGEYAYTCTPHDIAGMVGTIIVTP